VGYWFSGDVSFTRSSILSSQSVSHLLHDSAKKRALKWKKTSKKYKASGKDEAYIKATGGGRTRRIYRFIYQGVS
jgi:hypothetical protein